MATERPPVAEPSRKDAQAAAGAEGEQADGERPRSGLLIDWGGVLTTNLFVSFHGYCVEAGIDPKTLLGRFRSSAFSTLSASTSWPQRLSAMAYCSCMTSRRYTGLAKPWTTRTTSSHAEMDR